MYQLLEILTTVITAHDGCAECCLNVSVYIISIK